MLYSATLIAAAAASLFAPAGDRAGQHAEMLQVSASVAAPGGDSPAAPAAVGKADGGKETRYCVKQQLTGSRVPVRKCLTREQWIAAEDFDPLTAAQSKR